MGSGRLMNLQPAGSGIQNRAESAFLARSTAMGSMRTMGFVGTGNLQLTEGMDA